MKKELFEDKFEKFCQEQFLGHVYKPHITEFVLKKWEGKEEELFGSRYELMRFIYDNYFRYFDRNEVLYDVILQLIKDFKLNKIKEIEPKWYEVIQVNNEFNQDVDFGKKARIDMRNKQVGKMKEYIKESINE